MGTVVRDYVFFEKCVSNFHNKVPDLLKVYQSKRGTQGVLVAPERGLNCWIKFKQISVELHNTCLLTQ